jgi:ribose/xylose/arabinose/galactoside ABC-type transport system permease subunit
VSLIGIHSLAMTFVIMTAGIDLSVGSLLALSSSVVALILTRSIFPGPAGCDTTEEGHRGHRPL